MHAMIIAISHIQLRSKTRDVMDTLTLRSLTMDALSLCVMMSSVDTLTEHHPLCEYYLTTQKNFT